MGFLSALNSEFGIAMIAGLLAIGAALVTYYLTKRLKFFEAFFEKKTAAYEHYLSVIDNWDFAKDEDRKEFSTWVRIAQLYSSDKGIKILKDYADKAIRLEVLKQSGVNALDEKYLVVAKEFRNMRDMVVDSLREDIKQCREFKFD